MSNIVERYTWEDSLIEAESLGLLPSGAVNLCLRLAKAINWKPGNKRKGMPSGLYWKNEEALKAVNSSRATYFRYRARLFELGFFTDERGNLIPQVPDLSQYKTEESQIETGESQIETEESQIETGGSHIDTPYSEDTYSEDVLSEDINTEEEAALRAAETQGDIEDKEEKEETSNDSVESSFAFNTNDPGSSSLVVNEDIVPRRPALSGEVEAILNESLNPSDARLRYLDPCFHENQEDEQRARWAKFLADSDYEENRRKEGWALQNV